ncbi:unnamed protein product [Mytilus edulis]|uniref:Uncharacterized protein n=1 Tax=Mytilus edulis TaxID=6550 RepID=A0A8S3TP21_MYTED|nr:unnamed protein product [Mytilus edulis]
MNMNFALSIYTISFIIIFKIYEAYSMTVIINQNISRSDRRRRYKNTMLIHQGNYEEPRLTTKGQYLEGRVTLMNISKVSTEAVMIFDSLTCDDQTNYSCSMVYLGQNGRTEESHSGISTLYVKDPPSKPEYVAIVDVLEDESTTKETPLHVAVPEMLESLPGKFIWQKYRHGEKVPMNYTNITTKATEVPDKCSYYGISYLQFQVTALDNQAIIRCVLDSPLAKPYMYVEMKPIDIKSFTTTFPTISSSFTGAEVASESYSGYIGLGIGVFALVLLIAYGIFLFIRNQRERSYAVQRESTNRNLCIIDPLIQDSGHCEIISMTVDIDKETSVGAVVIIDDLRLPTNENLTRQEEDKDNQTPTNTSSVQTVCVNAQLKEEVKSQIPNKNNKGQSGERTNTKNHNKEQNMMAEKESSL